MGNTRNPAANGFNCPACNFFIEVTLQQLLSNTGITCPKCHQNFSMNKDASNEAMKALDALNERLKKSGKNS